MDRKGKSLINFLVNSPEETFFYKSIDVSRIDQDKVMAEIGKEHILQVIIDNHTSYANVGTRLMDTRKYLCWTPYCSLS